MTADVVDAAVFAWDAPDAPVVVPGPSQEQDEAAWREVRRAGIGGSDVSAILGLNRYRDAFAVYLDKTGQLDEPVENEPMAWGKRLEELVADVWADSADATGLTVVRASATLASPERPWQQANVDRLLYQDQDTAVPAGVYEGKTASSYALAEWNDGVPDHAALQGYHYLDVTGLGFVWVVALVGGQHLRAHRLERDDELIEHLRSVEAEFWRRVQDREPPAPSGLEATSDLLAHLYDVTPEKVVDLDAHTGDVLDQLERIGAAKRAEAEAKAASREAQNRIKALLGDAEIGLLAGQKAVSWKQMPEAQVAASTRAAHRRFLTHKIEGLIA